MTRRHQSDGRSVQSVTLDTILRHSPDLTVESFDDAVLIWDGTRRVLHHLDVLAALVWDELDGRCLSVVANDLAGQFSAEIVRVSDDVLALARRLQDEGLVQPGRS